MRLAVVGAVLLVLPACAAQRVTLTPDQSRLVRTKDVELEVVERAGDCEAKAAPAEPRRLKLEVDRIQVRYEGRRGSRSFLPSEIPPAGDQPWFKEGGRPSSVDIVERDPCAARTVPAILAGLAGGALMTAYALSLPPNDGLEGLAFLAIPPAMGAAATASLFVSVPLTRDSCSGRSTAVRVIAPSAPSASAAGSLPETSGVAALGP